MDKQELIVTAFNQAYDCLQEIEKGQADDFELEMNCVWYMANLGNYMELCGEKMVNLMADKHGDEAVEEWINRQEKRVSGSMGYN